MESCSISCELTERDWEAYRRAVAAAVRRATSSRLSAGFIVLAIVIGIVIASLFDTWGYELTLPSFVLGLVLAILMWTVNQRLYYRGISSRQRDSFLGKWTYVFGADGVRVTRTNRDGVIGWPLITDLVLDGEYLFLWLDNFSALTVAMRDLPSDVRIEDLLAQIDRWKATPAAPIDPSPNIDVSIAEESATPIGHLSQGAALLRLLTLRKTDGAAIVGSDALIAMLACLSFALWTLFDMTQSGPESDFSIYNAPTFALIALTLLVAAWAFARRSYPRIEFRRVLLTMAAFVPVATLALAGIEALNSLPWQVFAGTLLSVYAIVYFLRALTALSGRRQINALIFGGVVVLVVALSTGSMNFDSSLWYGPDEGEAVVNTPVAAHKETESLLYEQRDRIDEALDAIQRPAKDPAAIFFVGFAGVGEQRVFAEEIKLASQVVGTRYRTQDRSLLLINDRRDLDSHPLASTTGLRYALQALAERMDVDRDILFLSLSSHGSAKPLLSVSNAPLPLNDMTASDLASALRESGIKWRVIVISACYAGAFMGHLRDPYTIVIAAAASDRTSFGCADDRDLTYFGEAFYRDALPNSTSLVDAFNRAKAAIARREAAENITPSNPQAFFGEQIEEKLISLKFDTADSPAKNGAS